MVQSSPSVVQSAYCGADDHKQWEWESLAPVTDSREQPVPSEDSLCQSWDLWGHRAEMSLAGPGYTWAFPVSARGHPGNPPWLLLWIRGQEDCNWRKMLLPSKCLLFQKLTLQGSLDAHFAVADTWSDSYFGTETFKPTCRVGSKPVWAASLSDCFLLLVPWQCSIVEIFLFCSKTKFHLTKGKMTTLMLMNIVNI